MWAWPFEIDRSTSTALLALQPTGENNSNSIPDQRGSTTHTLNTLCYRRFPPVLSLPPTTESLIWLLRLLSRLVPHHRVTDPHESKADSRTHRHLREQEHGLKHGAINEHESLNGPCFDWGGSFSASNKVGEPEPEPEPRSDPIALTEADGVSDAPLVDHAAFGSPKS